MLFLSSFTKKLRALFAAVSIIMLIGFANPSFADTRLQYFYGLGQASDLFQDIEFKPAASDELDARPGLGILFDWTMPTPDSIFTGGLSGHAVSIEYYDVGEEDETRELEITSLFVGYRYHFLGRFYAGASIALASSLTSNSDSSDSVEADANPIAYTLGYSHRFPLGMTLGVHYINTLATNYEIDNRESTRTEFEDVTFTTMGATIGFRF